MTTQTETPAETVSSERLLRPRRWPAALFVLALAVLLVGLLAAGVIPRALHVKQLEKSVAVEQSFTVASATPGAASVDLVLPSSVEASQTTPLYPRVNGYVKRIVTDIGSRVNAGDVLAEIETPELDQQVKQAQAALEQANANFELANVSLGRWREMQKNRVVAPQEVDERQGALDARKADRTAATANLQRLTQMQSFQKITAPFAGTVTKRMVEVGQLVTGDLNDSTRVLFHLEHTAALRAYINVPQSYFRFISVGQTVALNFRELPGRDFAGHVVRTAGALDNATRTLRTEIEIPNEAGELLPGLYAEVRFQVERTQPPITVPARALITQAAGPQIATIDAENRVTLHAVTLARDLGKTLEIATGLEAGARFIVNPTDTIRDGMTIKLDADAPKIATK